jgi:hypothetical protein
LIILDLVIRAVITLMGIIAVAKVAKHNKEYAEMIKYFTE